MRAVLALCAVAVALAVVIAGSRSGSHGTNPARPGGARHGPADARLATVTVLNGTAQTGKAAAVAARLHKAGFRVPTVGDAREPAAASTITYRPADAATARAVARALGLPATAVRAGARAAPSARGVVVVIGRDLR